MPFSRETPQLAQKTLGFRKKSARADWSTADCAENADAAARLHRSSARNPQSNRLRLRAANSAAREQTEQNTE
jgi:hypothetical protein